MKYQLHSEIDIDASPEVVWAVLSDLDGYHEWNPFVVSAKGTVAVGERLTNRIEPPGGKGMTFKPTVTVVEADQVFEWLGRLGVPGIFDGRHRFELEATASGTHFTQSEFFNGALVRFLKGSLDDHTRKGFEAMNRALKDRAEARVKNAG